MITAGLILLNFLPLDFPVTSFRKMDRRLRHAVELFNRQEFFACHDVLEEIWSEIVGPEREFYQGLIHAAVALFHFSEGNLGGARKMYGSAVRYLTPFELVGGPIDVSRLLRELTLCFQELLSARCYPLGLPLPADRVPQLHLLHSGDRTL